MKTSLDRIGGPISNPLLLAGLGVGTLLVGLAVVKTRTQTSQTLNAPPFEPVLNPVIIREDAGGSGRFGAGRIGHIHQGTDFVCRAGQEIYAPFDGRVTRKASPYADDLRWQGMVLKSTTGNYECKLFYCTLAEPVGATILRGQLIGFCQGISKKYSSGVTDHLHVEVRQSDTVLNPEMLWRVSLGAIV